MLLRIRFKSLLLLLLATLLLAACSQISLAYRNLDWLIPWRVDQYLSLDSQQKAWLKPRIAAHLDWHCSSELPRYVTWLQETRDLALNSPDADSLDEQMIKTESAFQDIVRQINGTSIELLKQLNDQQVAGLYKRMDEDRREDQQKYLQPPLDTQISERAERLEKRLRPWFGKLHDGQRQRIVSWASERREQNRLWLENRARWQSEFRTVLDQRQRVDFTQRMTLALENRRGAHDQQAAADYRESRQALARLFADLLGSADDNQREQLRQRFEKLQNELGTQICSA